MAYYFSAQIILIGKQAGNEKIEMYSINQVTYLLDDLLLFENKTKIEAW